MCRIALLFFTLAVYKAFCNQFCCSGGMLDFDVRSWAVVMMENNLFQRKYLGHIAAFRCEGRFMPFL